MKTPMKKKKVSKVRRVKGYADIGSHGWIFVFVNGNYPGMLHIYNQKITQNLKPVTITYKLP